MAINFPDSPTNGQSATLGGNTWTYNSTSGAWARASSAGGSSITTYDSTTDLPLSGVDAGDQAFVTGSNRMYVSNGTGWYSVSLVNTNPSITSVQDSDGGSTPFTLATDGTGTVITVTASDPEDVPLTYSYSVTSGSLTNGGGTTATVVQGTDSDVNKFTITPSSTEAYAGTFELTFTASDGINQGTSANSFTLEFITIIANSKYTTLLATAVDTSDNNNITDASTNNHSITVNGDAHAGTFSPYRSGGYSSYGHFRPEATVGSTVDTWSLSFWYKLNSIVDNGFFYNSQSSYFEMKCETDNGGRLYIGANYFQNDGSGNNYVDNNWHYFVMSRNGSSSTTNLYIDGQQLTTDMFFGAVNLDMGSISAQAVRNMVFGGIDATSDLGSLPTTNLADINFRDIELKSTTHDGSVPTEAVTSSSDTIFLTAHKPYPVYEYGATPTSAPIASLGTNFKVLPLSPYDYDEYDAADHGGSVYFDGSGDRITASTSNNFAIGSSEDFIIEAWIYPTNTSQGDFHLFGIHQATYNGGIYLDYHSSDFRIGDYGGGWDVRTTSAVTLKYNTWQHICASRTGNLIKIFFNGESLALSSQGESHTNSYNAGAIAIGSGANGDFQGFISDIRFEKGTSRTSNFTPPTAPLSSTGTELHIKGTDASIIDKSQGSNLKLVGNTTGSTTQAKFSNTKSMYFDGSSDRIEIDGPINLGTQPFTYEAWVYTTDSSWIFMCIGDHDGSSNNATAGPIIEYVNNDFYLYNFTGSGNTSVEAFVHNQGWKHVAFCRQSNGNHDLYLDGTRIMNYTGWNSQDYGSLDKILIGDYFSQSMSDFSGYFQDVRLTIGLSRYTANFTPPTTSLEG